MGKQTQRGFTLVEAGTAMTITVAALVTAISGFGGVVQKRHTEGVAAELAADLQFVRTEAVARNRGVRLSFDSQPDGARCYVIHTGAAGDCTCGTTGPALCSGDAVEVKTVLLPADGRTTVRANVASMYYDPVRATVSPTATIRVVGSDGRELRHVVNILGRVRTCAAAGDWAGYRAC
ncbi:MAG TPA: GspH/FimT family pseudopilin [Methylibium sp.]|nr:GspH/FimT family pseudopilin [Methylibium sp.]